MDLNQLLSFIHVVAVVQYGNRSSTAADIDLLIISDDFENMFFSKRQHLINTLLQAGKKLDLLCLTQQEWTTYQKSRPVYCQNILQGVFLYGNGFQ